MPASAGSSLPDRVGHAVQHCRDLRHAALARVFGRRLGVRLRRGGGPLADRRGHAVDVGRPHERRLRQRRQHVTHVAVRYGGEDRAAGGEVLERLVGDQARPAARRQVVHREEQEVGRAHQRDRLAVAEQAGRTDEVAALADGAVAGRQLAGQVELDPPRERRVGRDRALDRLRDEHVRARDDVQARGGAAEQAAARARAAQVLAEIRVHRAGVDDPERLAGPRRRRRDEVGGLVADRDRGHAAGELGHRRLHALGRLGGGHDHRRRGRQGPPHLAEHARVVQAGRLRAHLVERPRVLEIGHPGQPERLRHAGTGERRLVRQARRVDDIGAAPYPFAQPAALVDPPVDPRWREAAQPLHPRGGPGGLGALEPVHLHTRPDAAQQLLVARLPAVAVLGHAGDHDGAVAEGVQVADGPQGAVDASPADRRKLSGEEQNPAHASRC